MLSELRNDGCMLEASSNLALDHQIFPSEDEKMLQLAERIKRDLDQLHGAAQRGDNQGTANAVKTAVSDVGQQLALASVLGMKSKLLQSRSRT